MTFQERYLYDPKTDLLGKGGFARVYKAYDNLLARHVALKIFNTGEHDRYSVVEEIKKMIHFRHPNLLAYYDVALIENTNAIGETEVLQIGIMELVNAGDLRQYARSHPGSPLFYSLLQQVLSGLEYLHNKGIIHRDLKPQNILLNDEDGILTAKISDFGISKKLDNDSQSSSITIGTVEYMAPEQFNPAKYGINGKITTNLDLWSFGIMVHELLTQEPLFGQRDGKTTAEEIMASILSNETTVSLENLSSTYREVVRKCLVKDAAKRIQKAGDLSDMLKRQHVEGASVDTPTIPQETKHFSGAEETLVMPKLDTGPQQVLKENKKNWKLPFAIFCLTLLGLGMWYFRYKAPADKNIVSIPNKAQVNIPEPTGYINDFENILTPQQIKHLDSIIVDYEHKTGVEIAIVTLGAADSLLVPGNFDSLVVQIGRQWGVGKEKLNNGITIGFSPGLRKISIRTGYGIEPSLSNRQISKIMSEKMIPKFKDGNFYQGLLDGLLKIMDTLNQKNTITEPDTMHGS